MFVSPVVSGRLFLWSLSFIVFPPSLLYYSLNTHGKTFMNPFRTECSRVSHSLHIVQLWVSVNRHPLKEETSLMRIEQCTDVWALQYVIKNHIIAMFL